MSYEPQPDSLAAHVVGYFRLHPDEHLTLDDIATKFSSGRSNIHTLLARTLDAELLKREKAADGDWIYRAGKELKPVSLPAIKPERKPTEKRAEIELDQLEICDDPLPASRSSPGAKYVPLFTRLKPGQAIKCKPEETTRVAHAMRKWITQNKLPYIMRLQVRYHADGQGRVWLLEAPTPKFGAEAAKLKRAA